MNKIDYSLMFVTDERIEDNEPFFHILEQALVGGASIIQLREKQLDTARFYQRALQAMRLCKSFGVPMIINDRIDLALAVDADGVHLGQKDMPVAIARQLLAKGKIVGLSVSNEQEALEANALDVDYIGLSPVFATATKTKDLEAPLGIEGLKNIRLLSPKPIVCIGGITTANTASLIESGASGIAVVSAISKAQNPQQATANLKKIICQTGLA